MKTQEFDYIIYPTDFYKGENVDLLNSVWEQKNVKIGTRRRLIRLLEAVNNESSEDEQP